jgi:hypothetical protein
MLEDADFLRSVAHLSKGLSNGAHEFISIEKLKSFYALLNRNAE